MAQNFRFLPTLDEPTAEAAKNLILEAATAHLGAGTTLSCDQAGWESHFPNKHLFLESNISFRFDLYPLGPFMSEVHVVLHSFDSCFGLMTLRHDISQAPQAVFLGDTFAVWINRVEHISVVVYREDGDIPSAFAKLNEVRSSVYVCRVKVPFPLSLTRER